jgi:hypothetical protein
LSTRIFTDYFFGGAGFPITSPPPRPYGTLLRIEAGWPGSLSTLPVSTTLSSCTLVPMLWAIRLLTRRAGVEWTQCAMSMLVASDSAYAYLRHKELRLK